MTRVVIANCYNDNNRGSAALTIAAIDQVTSALESPSIAILPLAHDSAGSPRHDFRHTLATFPGIEILPPLFSPRGRLDAVRTMAAARGRLGVRGLDAQAVEAVASSAMVVSRGGVVLHAREGTPSSIASFVTRTHAFGVARRHRIPTVLYGAQVGPFPSHLARRVARSVLAPTTLALPRDAVSASTVRQLLPAVRVEPIPDTCFRLLSIDGVPEVGTRTPADPTDIAIVVAELTRVDSSTFHATLRRLVLDWLEVHPESGVRFVVQVNGPRSSDARATEDAAESLRAAVPGVAISIAAEDLHPLELIELYRSCALVLSSRLHAVLMALAAGTPAVSLSTGRTFKERAVLAELGLPALAPTTEKAARELVAEIAKDAGLWRRSVIEAIASARNRLEALDPILLGVSASR